MAPETTPHGSLFQYLDRSFVEQGWVFWVVVSIVIVGYIGVFCLFPWATS